MSASVLTNTWQKTPARGVKDQIWLKCNKREEKRTWEGGKEVFIGRKGYMRRWTERKERSNTTDAPVLWEDGQEGGGGVWSGTSRKKEGT